MMKLIAGALSMAAATVATVTGPSFWLPEQASTVAASVDRTWALVYWLSVFFFVLITGLTVYFSVRFRKRDGYTAEPSSSHNTALEVFWTVIPCGLIVVLFWQGYKTYMDQVHAPADSYEVLVTGQKWNWLFTYPNGYVDGELHVPVDQPVRLVMSSEDVMHAMFIPAFRVKRDVIPGRYTEVWFEATMTGEFDMYCAEYCGTSHSTMLSKVVVHPADEFDAWLEEASDFLSRMPPAEAGALLYNQRGCKQCHSVDGSSGIGPTFANLFGSLEQLASGGAVTVDENYIRESILYPQAEVTAGYDPVMPTYQGRLKDEEISAIIEYLKTLAE